jgi:cytochrome c553
MSFLNLKMVLPAAILVGGFLLCTTASYGTVEYAKNTKKACTFCHEKTTSDKDAMKANLTDAGKYYKEKKTLDGYTPKK